jgi:hypothetical protein
LRDAEALLHAAAEAAEAPFTLVPQVHFLQQRFNQGLPFAGVRHPFQQGDMVEHLVGAHARIHAELLGQVAQHPAHLVLLVQHVKVSKLHRARVGLL